MYSDKQGGDELHLRGVKSAMHYTWRSFKMVNICDYNFL